MKKAFLTHWHGITSIVAATSRGKAIAATVRSATEAGYKPRWQDVIARRAPRHDAWAAVDATGVPWGEEYLPKGMVTQ